MPSVTIVIPALNEERRIGATLETVLGVGRKLPGVPLEILVVDDGSRDATSAVVAGFAQNHPQVRLIRHDVNQGLGCVVRTGLAQATGERFLIVPGDNDMSAETIHTLLAHAGTAEMVMCYFPDRKSRGLFRQFLSGLFGFAYRVIFGVHVEYLNGPCLYPVAQLRKLTLQSTRFSIVAEINVKLLRQGLSFVELPGRRQVGLEGSTSLSARNLRETLRVFGQLIWQVHVTERRTYSHHPRRVLVDPPSSPVRS